MKKHYIIYLVIFVVVLLALLPKKLSSNNIKSEGYVFNLTSEKAIYLVKVTGIKNKIVQFRINQRIKEDTLAYLIDCKETNKYVEGKGWYAGIVSNRYFYVVNTFRFEQDYSTTYFCLLYDLKTGKKVVLDDLFEVNDTFVKVVKEYGHDYTYDVGESLITMPGYENETEEYIADTLSNVSMSQEEWNEIGDRESYYKPDFLITEDNLYLRVPIPLDKLEEFLKVPKWW